MADMVVDGAGTLLPVPHPRRRAETTSPKGGKTISQLGSGCLGLVSLLSKFLCKKFEAKLMPEECFSPLDLFNKIQEQNEELGLIIDLTYTQRYYKVEDLPETISYIKIFTVGHQIPDNDTIFQFKCAVKEFLKKNKNNDKLIGVHCTHGLNRTGYLICRYLIDVEGMRPDDAIELFNSCRGHCIERQNYIENLQKRHVRKNRNVSAPRTDGLEDSADPTEQVYTNNKPVKKSLGKTGVVVIWHLPSISSTRRRAHRTHSENGHKIRVFTREALSLLLVQPERTIHKEDSSGVRGQISGLLRVTRDLSTHTTGNGTCEARCGWTVVRAT